MKKVLFLTEKSYEFKLKELSEKKLNDTNVEITSQFNSVEIFAKYDLVVLWNYQKIIKNAGRYSNTIVFHSSELPKGKGWAPIFYTVFNEEKFYCITAILAEDKVDSGNIIAKAKFEMKDSYTASILREFDDIICFDMLSAILNKLEQPYLGIQQNGYESFYERRTPEDNEISLNSTINEVFTLLRSCEDSHSAFVNYKGVKYKIIAEPFEPVNFPDDLKIEVYDSP